MKSVQYSDHVAFSLNTDEHIVYLGQKILKETYHANLIPVLEIKKNGQTRLLFSTEGMTSISDVSSKLIEAYRKMIICGLAQTLKMIYEQPFWKKEFLDVRPQYVFIDMANGTPGFILTPVDSWDTNDKDRWISRFEKFIRLLISDNDTELPDEYRELVSKLGRLSYALETRETDISQEAEIFISFLIDKWAEFDQAYGDNDSEEKSDNGSVRVELRYNGLYGSFGIYIGKDEFVIGKDSGCDGVISINSAISRQHVKIMIRNDGCFAQDLGSTNHTWLNGQLLTKGTPARLKEDDMLRLANMDFQVHIDKKCDSGNTENIAS